MEPTSNDKACQVVFLIGGNLGDRLSYLQQAENLLSEKMSLIAASRIFETEAWGGNSEGNYLNKALLMQTGESPDTVLKWSQEIEDQLQRVRTHSWGNRTMDIDIIYFGNRVINKDHLKIPHPQLQNRKFVLEPLTDIIPDWNDPRSGMTVSQMNERCEDLCKVWPYN
jgi:2-amino-4-hydroxy-6-hydroxymethyldihydropteridine diphosphokinase